MTDITKRQEYILGLIVREYVNAPTPIGSKALVEKYHLNVSSATVRNDMAALEERGLVEAPHTSAGRVPTEAGYRYFVHKLINNGELSQAERRTIRHQFHQSRLDVDQWLRLAASVLAHTARSASVVTPPQTIQPRFKHIELIHTHGRLVLMVLVLEGGGVRQQMLTLAEPVTQERLSQLAIQLNELCAGLDASRIHGIATHLPALEQEVLELVIDLLGQATQAVRTIYSDGLVNVLDPTHLVDQLEIADEGRREELLKALAVVDSEGARQTLHLLEEQRLLEEVLAEALSPGVQGVQVMIAGEGRWEELNQTSMILSHYGISGQTTGAIGVLGPVRLQYGRAISAVRYVAGLMSDMLIDIYGEGN